MTSIKSLTLEWIITSILALQRIDKVICAKPVPASTSTSPPVPAPEPELKELKCYGKELEVDRGPKTEMWDSYCATEYGGKNAKEKGSDCAEIDCLALAKKRLGTKGAKHYPRSCFSHSINQFNGKYYRIHSCGPDVGEVIPYALIRRSLEKTKNGLDNGYLRKVLEEDCQAFEIKREHVGLKRVCMLVGNKCTIEWKDPGKNGEKLDELWLKGGSICPGHYVCQPRNEVETDSGNPVTTKRCACEQGFKVCALVIKDQGPDKGKRYCAPRELKRSEIAESDAICNFAIDLDKSDELAAKHPKCVYNVETGCSCPEHKTIGTGDMTVSAHCHYFPGFKNGVLKKDMKDICRKKTRSIDGVWFPTGYEAETNSLCYCNKGTTACNGTPKPHTSADALTIAIQLILIFIIKF